MQFGSWQFRPALVPTLAVAVLLPALVGLGVWQVQRAQAKFSLRALHEQRVSQPALDSAAALGNEASALLGRKVQIKGRFDLAHQVLLDNRTYEGVPGYYVYAPLHLQDSRKVVLVNRGWVAQGPSRQQLPDLQGPKHTVLVQGVVGNPPSVGLKLGAPGEGYSGWPKVVQYLDYGWFAHQLGYALLPYTIYQQGPHKWGLIRDWPASILTSEAMPPEKHMSYAVQWFALAVVLLIIYISVNLRKTNAVAGVEE